MGQTPSRDADVSKAVASLRESIATQKRRYGWRVERDNEEYYDYDNMFFRPSHCDIWGRGHDLRLEAVEFNLLMAVHSEEQRLEQIIEQLTLEARSLANENENGTARLYALQRKRLYEDVLEKIPKVKMTLETMILYIEWSAENAEAVKALNSGKKIMTKLLNDTNIEKVDNIVDDFDEQLVMTNEVSLSLGQSLFVDGFVEQSVATNEVSRSLGIQSLFVDGFDDRQLTNSNPLDLTDEDRAITTCNLTDDDVRFGCNAFDITHPANCKFLQKVRELRPWYKQSKKERNQISDLLVETLKCEGCRFFEKGADEVWRELSEEGSRRMTRKALMGKLKMSSDLNEASRKVLCPLDVSSQYIPDSEKFENMNNFNNEDISLLESSKRLSNLPEDSIN
ncbi:hypothetical protein ACHAXR_002367, partial [Thalassiosira sp. AJA248-18]